MVDPKLLCRKHILGEHFEIHCAIGNLKNGGRLTMSLAKKGYLEPQNFKERHDRLVEEMKKRGYNHATPVESDSVVVGRVDITKSVEDLIIRCGECRKRIYDYIDAVRCETCLQTD